MIEDAAQAIGAKQNGKPACSLGFAGCLSFYPTKNLGAFGDAGAICTNDDAFADTCRLLRVHGSGHHYHHKLIGGMFRLAAIQAAVLDVKLKYLNSWHEGRRRNAEIYDKLLAGSKVITPKIEDGNWSIYNQYVVRVPDRDAVKQKLADAKHRHRHLLPDPAASAGVLRLPGRKAKATFPKPNEPATKCWPCRSIRS